MIERSVGLLTGLIRNRLCVKESGICLQAVEGVEEIVTHWWGDGAIRTNDVCFIKLVLRSGLIALLIRCRVVVLRSDRRDGIEWVWMSFLQC